MRGLRGGNKGADTVHVYVYKSHKNKEQFFKRCVEQVSEAFHKHITNICSSKNDDCLAHVLSFSNFIRYVTFEN